MQNSSIYKALCPLLQTTRVVDMDKETMKIDPGGQRYSRANVIERETRKAHRLKSLLGSKWRGASAQ
jgi:hypothetical protein